MPNHVHFIAIPNKEYSLAKTFNTSHMRYAQYFNKKNNLIGHLWQGRFFSCVLDEIYLYAVVRYIENNPIRANLVKYPEDWRWSSALAHLNKGISILSLSDISNYIDVENWNYYLLEKKDNSIINKLKTSTLNGKPLGNDMFIIKLEKLLGIQIKTRSRGRPRIY
jgi:putative transposase